MSDQNIDSELKAIQTLLSTLEPLDKDARKRVIDYVFQRLEINIKSPLVKQSSITEESLQQNIPSYQTNESVKIQSTDIRSFANDKNPKNDVERTALVTFYLTELAQEEKKSEISPEDITKYFKQAGFPIPSRPRQVLVNTKNAGYIDSTGNRGGYKLNPVGYNLVAFSLPSDGSSAKPRKRNKPTTQKKVSKSKK